MHDASISSLIDSRTPLCDLLRAPSHQGAAAVDLDGLSGDQGAGLGGEQQRRADRVLGGGEAAHGMCPIC